MRKRNSTVKISSMYCTQCGNRGIPIARTGAARESGHLKNIYCLYCNRETNHCEIRSFGSSYTYQDFIFEFENGNFDKHGNRVMSYGELKNKVYSEIAKRERAQKND